MSSTQSLLYLTGVFVAWKTLLLFVAWSAPGEGYDTSTSLLSHTNKLVRWDAIYYVQTAHRGHVFEQEWAFGMGLSTILSTISRHGLGNIITAGILLAHFSHFVSLLCLWKITKIFVRHDGQDMNRTTLPFVACCLYIVSPAGIFLSAPYSEGPFAALNMLGFWLYFEARSTGTGRRLTAECTLLITAGVAFGAATLVRSNGILSGFPFLFDALALSYNLVRHHTIDRALQRRLVLLASTVIAGLSVGAGLVLPQYLAYREYCLGGTKQPWCSRTLPLIYSYVQSHYWGVGFLRYWLVSNVPLFLLAMPSLALLIYSGATAIAQHPYRTGQAGQGQWAAFQMAVPQLVLASLAITNYHVQVITRFSSGYPWVYIWLAKQICSGWNYAAPSLRFFMLYGLIQAALFASFLPPA